MITTLLSILIGFQLVQTVALVVLFRVLALQRKDLEKSRKVIVNIKEARYPDDTACGRFPWYLYEPGSIERPGSTQTIDKYRTAHGAIRASHRKFPGVRVVVTDAYFENIDPQAVLDHRMIEAGTSK